MLTATCFVFLHTPPLLLTTHSRDPMVCTGKKQKANKSRKTPYAILSRENSLLYKWLISNLIIIFLNRTYVPWEPVKEDGTKGLFAKTRICSHLYKLTI